jgi:hypothetical protein
MSNNRQQKDPKMNDLIAAQKIEGLQKLKAMVIDSVSSPIALRGLDQQAASEEKRLKLLRRVSHFY